MNSKKRQDVETTLAPPLNLKLRRQMHTKINFTNKSFKKTVKDRTTRTGNESQAMTFLHAKESSLTLILQRCLLLRKE